MTRVYGGCIEPGGMELEETYSEKTCPECSCRHAQAWHIERAEGGSLNYYIGWRCDECGESGGDSDPDDCEDEYGGWEDLDADLDHREIEANDHAEAVSSLMTLDAIIRWLRGVLS